ncbi:DUF559 domain-containing protein [Candidatus Gracilibacteria bacterium]|nr:DUF559 domain-containing protein [Candidatus Gracilibacteria bacterium]
MKRVLVGLSGGVDSAVAAYLLKQKGYDVVAGFMKNYISDSGNCSTYQDAQEAIRVAKFLGIEIISFDLIKEYNEKIINYIYDGYKKGITPNPDVFCNNLIKFDVFLNKALEMGFDGIATGHYARIFKANIPICKGDEGGGKYIYYNLSLKEKARKLRNNQTKAEKKLWYEFLKDAEYKFLKQKPIDEYIVDFFCNKLKLIIEIDGDTHRSDEEIQYDKDRTKKLESYGFEVIRFTNTEIFENFDEVCKIIKNKEPSISPLIRETNIYRLYRGVDYNKDQSYFLSGLNQFQLSKSIFPIGDLGKKEVRKIAKEIGLPNAERKDSQGLCFVGNIPIKKFLEQKLPHKKGDIINMDGKKIGEHDGAWFYTIGQRRGLNLLPDLYVSKIDVKKNIIYVGPRGSELLNQKIINVSNWHRIGEEYKLPLDIQAKIRYRQEPKEATLKSKVQSPKSIKSDLMTVNFKEKQWAIAPGQIIVAYNKDECLGNGIIN